MGISGYCVMGDHQDCPNFEDSCDCSHHYEDRARRQKAPHQAPSAGATMTSLIHVLDKTDGVLDKGLREHLLGVLKFVSAAESAERR